jgi:hypothetical protein
MARKKNFCWYLSQTLHGINGLFDAPIGIAIPWTDLSQIEVSHKKNLRFLKKEAEIPWSVPRC